MTSEALKEQLIQACQQWLDTRSTTVKKTLADIKTSLEEETKSSAGDKHETGRAMLQIDRENAGRQLAEIEQVQKLLSKASRTQSTHKIHLGSLIETSQGLYFIAISAGRIVVEDKTYYVVAPTSPIGALLMGKEKGEQLVFNAKKIVILAIA